MRQVIEEELRRSFSASPCDLVVEPMGSCVMSFTANVERSCAQTEDDYQLGQVYRCLLVISFCLY